MLGGRKLVIKPRRITSRKKRYRSQETDEPKQSFESVAAKYNRLDAAVVELLELPKPVRSCLSNINSIS